jgi:hypothetical protein
MQECSPLQITQEEIAVASGKKLLDPASDFISKLESANGNIQCAFDKQVEASTVSYCVYHRHISDEPGIGSMGPGEIRRSACQVWIVATDQLFDTVDQPEFHDLMTYAHHPLPSLKIPHHNAIKQWIMKIGEDSIVATKQMFLVHRNISYVYKVLISS